MKLVLQRVARASVRVEGEVVGRIGPGALILLAAVRGDGPVQADRLAERLARFRFFGDESGRMGSSLLDVGGGALVVSQLTLAHDDTRSRGPRPSFDRAAAPGVAEPLVERFTRKLRELGVPTETGRFGATMEIELTGEGPVTFLLEEQPP